MGLQGVLPWLPRVGERAVLYVVYVVFVVFVVFPARYAGFAQTVDHCSDGGSLLRRWITAQTVDHRPPPEETAAHHRRRRPGGLTPPGRNGGFAPPYSNQMPSM